ncbi:hypothetical protein, partial [Klebsiella pneumoniae]|uniref:hypothetical protein n=1 Tax=Klebsiella pneumoniae TaxID=573 RepID=UPI001C8F1EE5
LNMLCIFKQDDHYTRKNYNNFVGSDMSFKKFIEICDKCWKEDYGFLTVNLLAKHGKYMNKSENLN